MENTLKVALTQSIKSNTFYTKNLFFPEKVDLGLAEEGELDKFEENPRIFILIIFHNIHR